MRWGLYLLLAMLVLAGCSFNPPDLRPPKGSIVNNSGIVMPQGFSIDTFADVPGARSMTLSPDGVLFVGTRSSKVYAVLDNDKDFKADEVKVIAEGLNMPNGVAFKDGDLYVAEVNRILRFNDIENNLESPAFDVISNDFPSDAHHGWKYLAFGPDGKLYVPVGAPCNLCDEPGYASIYTINSDGSGKELFASGIRNTVGFDWHPITKELYFTDNGRDLLGDDTPPDEFNKAEKKGLHFGYPYCHAGDIIDPEFGDGKDCSDYLPPVRKLGPHVASLGIKFYNGNMFPEEYKNQAFIAEHGSWNRAEKIGYRISVVKLSGNDASYETFAEGWLLKNGEVYGRPVDILIMPDGSMLVSDDYAGKIYRIIYNP